MIRRIANDGDQSILSPRSMFDKSIDLYPLVYRVFLTSRSPDNSFCSEDMTHRVRMHGILK